MLEMTTLQRSARTNGGARAAWRRAAACSLGLVLASGCLVEEELPATSEEPSHYIMSLMHALSPEDDPQAGYSCSALGTGGGLLSGDETNNLWTRELTDDSGLSVEIGSFDQLLAQRYYDRDFIESRAVDQFVVTAADGVQYEFIYWGSDECETCPPAPYAPPPNNPWGCGPGDAEPTPEIR